VSAAAAAAAVTAPLVIGRYALFDELAAGGMATVHLGRLLGPVGFGRTVAVKRLHAHYLKDPEFITMFMDEARIVARIRHPNVVPMVDVVQGDQGLFLVMEYVHGESLSRLMRSARKAEEPIPPRIVAAIMCGVLLGLHAAHETKGPDGVLLDVVHRDVSPQNVIVGSDGSARVLDFGIAKAAGRAQVTREGQIKGKLAYMAPEQIRGQVDRRTDVFAAAVVLWEMLAGRRLHGTAKDVDIVARIVQGNLTPPSTHAPHITPELDDIVMRALASDPKKRVASARDLALELERKVGLASPSEVTAWVERLAADVLDARANLVTAMELAARDLLAIATNPPPPTLGAGGPIDFIPPSPQIPVHLDLSHAPYTEVPSSSAVFAHAQTTPHAENATAGPRRTIDRSTWVVVALSCAMALIGFVLGGYALVRRSARAERQRPTTPMIAPTTTVVPRGAAVPSTVPSAVAPPDVEAEPAATATATANPTGAGTATSTATGTATATATATSTATSTSTATATATIPAPAFTAKPPAVLPPPGSVPTARKPAGKPSCDPPYTVDDVGHRHYEPECMGLE
jgi:serine/threonine protein kinase